MPHEIEDLTVKKGKSMTVLNVLMYPVVVNSEGQTLGGQKFGKVSISDPAVKRALDSGFIKEVL